ncbi:GGDEF domain-containing protein [Vibrio ordalii]|uniref:GGDEF domain-containing protein n=1 Tax=Vibrio ordalii TaxID=28174 RepID=UPI00024834DA|nr:GGDEF domain-containing protein [Vibrio ordalii]
MDARLFNHSHYLRTTVLCGLSLLLTAIAFFLVLFNVFYTQSYGLAALEFIFMCYSSYVYFIAKQQTHSATHIRVYVYFLIFIISAGTFIQPLDNGLFLWTTFFPVLFYLLMGVKHGRLATSIALIPQLFNIYYQASWNEAYDPIPLMINLLLCYCVIWTVAHIFESSRKKTENSLRYLASRDALTGSHNRLALTHAFAHFVQNRGDMTLCLLVIDLDYFKQVNDTYGHDAGDKVLIDTVQVMSQIVGDDNLYRIGGEEFCVTLFDHSIAQAEHVGEKLREVIDQHLYAYDSKQIQLTLSVGICEYREGDKLDMLLKLADVELYNAKKNGRNQVRICQINDSKNDATLWAS